MDTRLLRMTEFTSARDALRTYFGYDAFRPGQEGIVNAIIQGRDALGVMPTGAGKSICYQIPATLLPGMTVVISPLISLMRNQVDALNDVGIPAAFINTTQSPDEQDLVFVQALSGRIRLLYVAPERLETERFRTFASRVPISLVAVDEAHCVSQWGQDFRSSYLGIGDFLKALPTRPTVAAFTATATERVRRDIIGILGLRDPSVTVTGFDRANLYFDVIRMERKHKASWVASYIADHPDESGIVYCATRKEVESLAESLNIAVRELRAAKGEDATRIGTVAVAYHGGMSAETRDRAQRDFVTDRVPVVVATNAFGMGIDKADVRFVVHYSMPDSLESYYQEAGRAGRDGKRAYAVLLVAPDDAERVQRRFDLQFPPLDEIRDIYEKVCSYLQIGIGDGEQASFVFNIHDFCAKFRLFGGKVASALKLLQQNGYLTLTDEMRNPARILFCISRDDLYKLRVVRNDLDHFIRTVLRLYDGVFTDFRPIDEQEIAAASGYKVEHVKELFKRLWQMRVIRYIPANQAPMLFFDCERLPAADLYIAPETYRRRQELAEERFSHMIAYAANETECRSTVLERYFGAADPAPCGVCDICLAARKRAKSAEAPLDEEILRQLDAEPLAVKELAARFRCDAERVLEAVERLQHAGKISTAESGKLAINR